MSEKFVNRTIHTIGVIIPKITTTIFSSILSGM